MPKTIKKSYYLIGAVVLIVSLFASLILESVVPLLIPVGIIGLGLTIIDFKFVFYILLFFLPLSIEVYFDNGLGTDLPDEPLMLLLTGVFIVYLLGTGKGVKNKFFWHPITLILFFHLAWMGLTVITSAHFVTSMKFFTSKMWFVIVFYFLAGHILNSPKEILKFIWIVTFSLLITVFYTLINHSFHGFTFASVNKMMYPFFRNHVSYAAMMAVMLPLIWFAKDLTDNKKLKNIFRKSLYFLIPLLLVAIYLSFTRAAYIAAIMMIPAYFLLRWSLVKPTIIVSLIIIPIFVYSIVKDNKFLEFAPDYKKAITHMEFDDLVEATYNLEDISTMERVYRWVGAYYMINEKPVFGFGPGNFYNFYKEYTISKFKTYVSDNPEKSGIHNYYLMTLVEQGVLGLLFFIGLIVITLLTAQRVYSNSKNDKIKIQVMISFLGILSILALLIINDLIETDKIGSLFFIFLALITNADIKTRQSLTKNISADE